MGSGGQTSAAASSAVCHQTSRGAFHATALPARRTTRTVCTAGHSAIPSSTAVFSGAALPRRKPPSAVITATQPPSWTRSRMALALKPPKITECGAPMRAQASSATASSGTIGM